MEDWVWKNIVFQVQTPSEETSTHRKQAKMAIKVCLFNDVHNVLVFTVENDGQSFCMAKPMVFHTFGRFVGQCLKPGNLLLRQFHSDRVFGKLKNHCTQSQLARTKTKYVRNIVRSKGPPVSLRLSSGSDCKWSRSAMVFSMKK